ncbi:Circadian clock-controlled protein [Harpegnathos saltator]|uniref:Circadian clock-controlled protein n=2 Tax=Harpegnathos saltator TaxID=610380 RepID=E2BGV2_HARSA|nr:Circadian clock-controlled protein [Harpegnathos saltator]
MRKNKAGEYINATNAYKYEEEECAKSSRGLRFLLLLPIPLSRRDISTLVHGHCQSERKMFVATVTLAFVVAYVSAEIPSYIHVCGRKDPNLDECILKNVENLRSKICEGIPELNVEPLEPLYIDKIDIISTDNLKISVTDVYISNLCNYEIKYFHLDLAKKHFDVELLFKRIYINMTYGMDARILVPVAMKGKIGITSDNVEAKAGIDLKVINKNGKEYVYVSNINLDIDIKEYKADLSSINDRDLALMRQLSENVISNNQQEMLRMLKPVLEDVVSKQIFRFANAIVKHFTYDELFPDRT